MSNGVGSGVATRCVLLVGGDGQAAAITDSLETSGVVVVAAPSVPVALASLDSLDFDCLVLLDGAIDHPADFFGAVQRAGHHLPGVFVGETTQSLPPTIEQVPPEAEAVASVVRQRLLAVAAAEADPVVTDDPLSVYGSTVAHELRNHLGAAGLAVESLEGATKAQATAALERLSDLATEAEAVATGTVAEVEVVSLPTVAADAADRIRVDGFSVETAGAQRTVEANRSLLVLFCENLFRNSVEHVGPGVTVRVVDTDLGFTVADDGPGFASDRPFEWGYTTGSGQGAGLGVVERIAHAHGWTVTAKTDGGARIDVVTE